MKLKNFYLLCQDTWTLLPQVGLHSIITFETGIKKVAEQEQSKWQFEEEIKALGAEEVQAEFAGYFTSIVCLILLSSWVNHQSR